MKSNKKQLSFQVVGYRSQLHDRGKVKTKSDLVANKQVGKKSRIKQHVSQEKPKQNKECSNYAKGAKPSRVAAKFNNGKLPDNKKVQTGSNKLKNTLQKSTNNAAASETAAFVTKNELTKLLETLNESGNMENNSLTQQGSSREISQPLEENTEEDELTKEMKTNKILEVPEAFFNDKESGSTGENNGEEKVLSDKTEIIKPIAMRSSFAIGAPGLVINNPHDDKAVKHRQWVKELEQQIQEKKMREKKMKENQSVGTAVYQPLETLREGFFSNTQNKESFRTTATVTAELQQETDRSTTGHARGCGLMSMLSESEADKQRKKIIEHQKAIQLQVEDRRRRKMEERERRLQEEAIEEERLTKEREKLQKQFQEEMIKMEQKEERAKHRAQVLQEGISKAFESAQQFKRDRRKNRLQGSTTEVSVKDENVGNQRGQQTISPDDNSKSQAESTSNVVPPLNLRSSISPINKSNEKLSSRIPESAINVKRNSLISARDVKTSYSETDKDQSETLINKWVHEDFCTNREQNYNQTSTEVVVPFHRTSSATLFRESLASQDNHEDVNGPASKLTGNERKGIKNGRTVPEVHSTRTSLLRQKGTNNKNTSLASRRRNNGVDRGQQSLQKSKPTSQKDHDDRIANKYKDTSSIPGETQTTTIPSHLLATFTPTAHQEKILEQLATLRKGLLLKDEEIKTRVVHINEYQVHA